jgi:hypothetical protein
MSYLFPMPGLIKFVNGKKYAFRRIEAETWH